MVVDPTGIERATTTDTTAAEATEAPMGDGSIREEATLPSISNAGVEADVPSRQQATTALYIEEKPQPSPIATAGSSYTTKEAEDEEMENVMDADVFEGASEATNFGRDSQMTGRAEGFFGRPGVSTIGSKTRPHAHPMTLKKIGRVPPRPRVEPNVIAIEDDGPPTPPPPPTCLLRLVFADLFNKEDSSDEEEEPGELQGERRDSRRDEDGPHPENVAGGGGVKDSGVGQSDPDLQILFCGRASGCANRPPSPKKMRKVVVARAPRFPARGEIITVMRSASGSNARAQSTSPIWFGPQDPSNEPPPHHRCELSLGFSQ